MGKKLEFSEQEKKFVTQHLNVERATSFSQSVWPFIFFYVPSFFMFCLFLSDGQKATGILAYLLLSAPYALSAFVDTQKVKVICSAFTKYENALKDES